MEHENLKVNNNRCAYCIFIRREDYISENTSCAVWCAKGYLFGYSDNLCPDFIRIKPRYKYTQIVYMKKYDRKLQKYVDDFEETEFKKALDKVKNNGT